MTALRKVAGTPVELLRVVRVERRLGDAPVLFEGGR
jgi:hypothetical protein